MAPVPVSPRMDAYRREQAALGGTLATRAAVLVAARMNVSDPDRGWAGLLAELLELIRGGRSISERLAMEFYRYLREADNAAGEAPEQPDIPFPTNAVVGSMIYTGPRMAKALIRRGDDADLADRVGRAVGRSAMRHTLNGGRTVMREAAVQDPAAWGWARITDTDPCDFCKMLADRGAVYKTAKTAGQLQQYHDGCACAVVAVFKGTPSRTRGKYQSRRGADGLTDRERAVIERVRREVHGS